MGLRFFPRGRGLLLLGLVLVYAVAGKLALSLDGRLALTGLLGILLLILTCSTILLLRKSAQQTGSLSRVNQDLQVQLAERSRWIEEQEKTNQEMARRERILQGLLEDLETSEEKLMKQQESLEAANRRLTELSRLKDEFVASVNHELRTPLTAIREGASLLVDGVAGRLTGFQRELLATVISNADRLAELVNAMLDLSKIEAGRMRLCRRRLDVRELIESLLGRYQNLRSRRILQADLSAAGEVFADGDRILEVLENLLSNAVKFTQEGGVIQFQVRAQEDSVAVSVTDNGVGIAKEELPRLFQKFSQVDRIEGPHRGTGLGLALCKELVELHQGSISVVSDSGKGSTFTFTLPMYTPEFALEVSFKEAAVFARQAQEKSLGVIAIEAGSFFQRDTREERRSHVERLMDLIRKHLHHDDAVFEVEPNWIVVLAISDPEGVEAILERLKANIPEWITIFPSAKAPFSGRVGVALYPNDGSDIRTLFAKATQAIGQGPSEVAHVR